ncbi:MAG: mycothiol synthase [Actinomycetes bacterium]
MTLIIQTQEHLSAQAVLAVHELVAASTAADAVRPLSEHVELHLRSGGDQGSCHLLAYSDDELVGYAHLDRTDVVQGPSAEVAVHPLSRRRGVARALVVALIQISGNSQLRLWAHGEQAAAGALALALGFERSRTLWQLRRSLYAPLPRLNWPPEYALRTFQPGVDEPAWLEINRLAFADLPDQGRWNDADLHRRMAEPWFDPSGFLIAERHGAMVGFHWTKVHGHRHPPGATAADHLEHAHELLGEVYVVGVAPSEKGHGLGRALTIAGLNHLRDLQLPQAMLYVDASNTTAIRLYESLGFTRWDTDVMFRHRG